MTHITIAYTEKTVLMDILSIFLGVSAPQMVEVTLMFLLLKGSIESVFVINHF